MENKYTPEEWIDLLGVIPKKYKVTPGKFLNFSKRILPENEFVACLKEYEVNKSIKDIIAEIIDTLYCSMDQLALKINSPVVNEIVKWRLDHGK